MIVCIVRYAYGHVAELVYAYVSEAYPVRVEGSSPSMPTANAMSGGHGALCIECVGTRKAELCLNEVRTGEPGSRLA